MRVLIKLVALLGLTLVFCTACSDELIDIGGGWVAYFESKRDIIVDNGRAYVPCTVRRIASSGDLIYVEQYPAGSCFIGEDMTNYKHGKNNIYYWVLLKNGGIVAGPLLKEEFENYLKSKGLQKGEFYSPF